MRGCSLSFGFVHHAFRRANPVPTFTHPHRLLSRPFSYLVLSSLPHSPLSDSFIGRSDPSRPRSLSVPSSPSFHAASPPHARPFTPRHACARPSARPSPPPSPPSTSFCAFISSVSSSTLSRPVSSVPVLPQHGPFRNVTIAPDLGHSGEQARFSPQPAGFPLPSARA